MLYGGHYARVTYGGKIGVSSTIIGRTIRTGISVLRSVMKDKVVLFLTRKDKTVLYTKNK